MNNLNSKKGWNYTIINNNVLYSSKLSINEKFIYMILCSFKNTATNQCYPSVKKIANLSCCSSNTVRKVLKSLEKKELISIEERKVDNVNCSNLYTILNTSPQEKECQVSTKIPAEGAHTAQVINTAQANYITYPSSKEEPLHKLKQDTSKDNGEVVQNMDEGTSYVEDKLYQYNHNNTNYNNITIYKKIVDHLNKKADTNYKFTTKKTKKLIKARINDGFTLENFYTVIDKKCDDWINTEYEKFLRPETIFGNKFENYLNQKCRKENINYGKYPKFNEGEFNQSEFMQQGIGL